MTKFGLVILSVLNDNGADTPLKALSISQIMELTKEKLRKSYSTTFRHVHTMEELGYVKCGLVDGLASTYLITDSGKLFCNAQ